MQVKPIKTGIFKEGDDLVVFIRKHVKTLPERSVLVVTSKIVSLAEKRTAVNKDILTKQTLIQKESDFAMPTKWTWLTLKDGLIVSSAGIDESNSPGGKLILLPKDCYKSAEMLRTKLMKLYKVKKLAIVIPDSRTLPLRSGALGVALGYAGMKGLKDYRGQPDIVGRQFRYERAGIVDSVACAATLAMGEGDERQPLAIVTGAPVEFTETVDRNELYIALEDDLYLPFLKKIPKGTLPSRKAKRM